MSSRPAKRRRSQAELTAPHQFITIGRYHRNEGNAKQYVDSLFELLPHTGVGRDRVVVCDLGPRIFKVTHREATLQARETGAVDSLRTALNRHDPYFVFTFGAASEVAGLKIELGFAGQKKTIDGCGRMQAVESELTADILEHRRLAAEHSLKGSGFRLTSLHWRSYVLCSCALVEAFLNRCVELESKQRTSPGLAELQKPSNIERRFELWLQEFAGEPLSTITRRPEWDHYTELRRLRNSLTHPTESLLGILVKDAARQLNLVRRGVGGLINRLREAQQLGHVAFAERLETAPECRFVPEPAAPEG